MNPLGTRKGRTVLFAFLYFSEGAPIGFIWWALPTTLRSVGVPVDQITLMTSTLVLPWMFKFVWAPLVDLTRLQRWTVRSWILTMQGIMGLSLFPLLFLDSWHTISSLYPFLLIHAVAAATQDAAIDALAISAVPEHERGSVNGWMQVGMLAGRSLLGGGALMMSRHLGEHATVLLLIVAIWSSSLLVLISREAGGEESGPHEFSVRLQDLGGRLRRAFTEKVTWLGLLFALVGGAAYEAVGAVAGPFLIDNGFSTEEAGSFFAIPSVLAMIGGALVGGYAADRWGKRRSVAFSLVCTIVTVWVLAASSAEGPERSPWTIAILTLLYLCIGTFTASSYALFMDLTSPRLGATQFSAFMGTTNACESWSTFAVGRAVRGLGYPLAFLLLTIPSVAALAIIKHLKARPRLHTSGPDATSHPEP
jgi:PAT family beta-lactamase induction signal transducer AmpG